MQPLSSSYGGAYIFTEITEQIIVKFTITVVPGNDFEQYLEFGGHKQQRLNIPTLRNNRK